MKTPLLATHGNDLFTLMFNFRDGNATLREFINAIERMINQKNLSDELANKYKGDYLEIFAEIFFNAFENDPSIGLKDYTPIAIENDYGVDATGINAVNNKVAVQVKYRSNPRDLVLYEEIAKTYTSGRIALELDLDKMNSIYVFTPAIGVTPACQKVLGNRLVILNIDIIGDYIRNNTNFWEYAFQEVYKYLN